MSSFPISVKSPSMNEGPQYEADVLAEIAGSVIDFTAKVVSKFQAKKPEPLSINEKIELARSSQTPASVLLELSYDPESTVRNELVFNQLVPATVLFRLAEDRDAFIRAQARTRLTMAA